MDAQEYVWNDEEQARENRERVKNKQNIEGYPSAWDVSMEKLKCPNLISRGNFVPSMDDYFAEYCCSLNDKPCTLEYEGVCEEWEEIKAEWQREET